MPLFLNKKFERKVPNSKSYSGGNSLFSRKSFHSVQFTQSCPTLCDSMNCSTPGFPVHHQLLELVKLMSVESVVPSNHLILCCPLLFLPSFPASGSFPMNEFFATNGQSTGVSASILPMNIQEWFPLGWTGWISFQFKGLSNVFSNTTVQKNQFFSALLSL